MKLPKIIWTIWLNTSPISDQLQQWIGSHFIDGFSHNIVTLENYTKFLGPDWTNTYVKKAIKNGRFAKAADYIRVLLLYKYGGVYLDADIEIVQPQMFLPGLIKVMEQDKGPSLICERESNGFIANSFIVSFPEQKFLRLFMERIDVEGPKGKDGDTWNYGMGAWTDLIHNEAGVTKDPSVLILPPNSYFGSVLIHHFLKSWKA